MFSTLENRKDGGLGVSLVVKLSADMRYERWGCALPGDPATFHCLVIGPWSASLSDPPDRFLIARARRCWDAARKSIPNDFLPVRLVHGGQPVVLKVLAVRPLLIIVHRESRDFGRAACPAD